MMKVTRESLTRRMRTGLLASGVLLFITGPCAAESAPAFAALEGVWTGAGNIELANGSREAIKCRGAYDLPKENSLHLDIRCASDSYKFELRGVANFSGGAVTGTWSEATRNAFGTISGTATQDRIEVLAKSASFSATLTLATRGDQQTIDIQSQDQKTTVKGATISLARR